MIINGVEYFMYLYDLSYREKIFSTCNVNECETKENIYDFLLESKLFMLSIGRFLLKIEYWYRFRLMSGQRTAKNVISKNCIAD